MNRLDRLKASMEELGYDSIVVFEPENIFYLTQFWGEGIAVLNKDVTLIVPRLEAERARKSKVTIIESERGSDMLKILAKNIDGRVVTDCNDHQTFMQLKSMDIRYDPSILYNARMIKDDDEIKYIKKASILLDRLFRIVEREMRIGVSELEVQALLMYEGLRMGLLPTSYKYTLHPLIVASGKNSSLPHAQPTTRKIRRGDLVTVDLTLRYNGYVSDATRTFAIDDIKEEQKKVYNIVREAQKEGIANLHDGIKAGVIDDTCRGIIKRSNYGKYFIHSTGHGIGVDVHEPPWIRSNSNQVLRDGMTITIEPGIYTRNFGVRIEDSLLVTKDGCRVFNRYTKELVII